VNKLHPDTNKKASDDPLFSGRGSPALMSSKEPALRLLKERYSETFAVTQANERQIHLFLVKIGMWSLVWTFTPRDVNKEDEIGIDDTLQRIERTLKGGDPEFLARLDASVLKAKDRIKNKAEQFRAR